MSESIEQKLQEIIRNYVPKNEKPLDNSGGNKYNLIDNAPLRRLTGMKPNNLCKLDGGGMSGCEATLIKKKSEKFLKQKDCPFFQEAGHESRCMFESFEKFCWSTEAQSDAKG